MRLLTVVTMILVMVLVFCEGKKHHDEYKVDKKSFIHMDLKKHHHHGKSRIRGSHLDLNEGGVISVLDENWMHPPKKTECKKKCGHKEFCVANPKTGDEKCISKRNFKESRRLFRSFHKEKEMLKKDKKVDLLNKDLTHAENMKDVYDLISDYNKFKKHTDKIEDAKSLMVKDIHSLPTEVASDNTQVCRPTELYELRKRMVGWFVLMHTESRRDHHKMKHKKHYKKHHKKHGKFADKHDKFADKHDILDKKMYDLKASKRSKRSVVDTVETESHKHCKCSKSAMWEFKKQDADRNGVLSEKELEAMSANRREPCMKPLLKSCDRDMDGALTHGEWCCCMAYTIPPCLEKKRLTDPDDWVPRCDKEGFYEREQCHDKSGYCWCVDLNGNAIVGTKQLGKAHCGKYDPSGHIDVMKN